jgi:hypothetical protein
MIEPNDRLRALKNSIDASPITPLHNYQKIAFKRNGKTFRGHFWKRNGMVITVKSSGGRQKKHSHRRNAAARARPLDAGRAFGTTDSALNEHLPTIQDALKSAELESRQ